MKKILTLVLTMTLLSSCSVKNEALDLYKRITDFFKDNTAVVTEIFKNDEEAPKEESDVAIDISQNDDSTVNINIQENDKQVVDVNLDKETYQQYDDLIEKAKEYIANNDVDLSRLSSDKVYAMKHAMKFSNQYNIDLNSLSTEDMARLQEAFTSK